MASRWHLSFLLVPLVLIRQSLAYDALARWGQATVVIDDALFIFGGKTDKYNAYSYTSAPNNNDILYLSLSSAFNASAPSWELLSSSTNLSTSQGPALAWGSLSAFNSSEILLFGGQPGPNSETVVTDAADSALNLNVSTIEEPLWISQPQSWAGEPTRRMRHSTVTALSGLVFIFGGEKVDLSNNAFSDNYVFDPNVPSFSLLSSDGGPPDLFGHTSIILTDQRILIFGGFSQSQGSLVPLSTIWILNTTESTYSWSVVETNTTNLPSPRMAFAAVLISDGKIIIHGGADSNLQTNFDDGWILDTTQNPMTWSPIDALSQLGARRDHFAVCSGNQIIFGFGYGNNGPASALLEIFDTSDDTFSAIFTPPSPDSPVTQTIPGSFHTTTKSPSTPSTPTKHTTSGTHPASTADPTDTGDNGNTSNPSSNNTAIAVGAAFGAMSLIIVGLGAVYYVRRRRQGGDGDRQFMALGADDDDGRDSPHLDGQIPIVGIHNEMGETNGIRGILDSLGITNVATKMRTIRNPQPLRRDMLADEDAQSFGEWYKARKKDGSGGSSWSLMNVFGAGTPRLRSREASLGGRSTPRREKSDPFADDAASVKDEETGLIGVGSFGSRPRARRELSYASSKSAVSYRDPFVDPIEEEPRQNISPSEFYTDYSDSDFIRPTVRQVQPLLPAINTILPLSQHPLTPLTERTSHSTLALQDLSASSSSHAHSSENVTSSFATVSHATSLTSIQTTTPASPTKSTFLIGVPDPVLLQSNQPMKRSDSWWSRFSRSSLLDRRSSDGGRTILDIRDPNPAPRLGPIEEGSLDSGRAERSTPGSEEHSAPAQQQNSHSVKAYNATGHGKSMSSLRTADSDAIERMAGTMDVVQTVNSRGSRWSSASRSSIGGMSIDTKASASEMGEHVNVLGDRPASRDGLPLVASPVDVELAASPSRSPPSSPPSALKTFSIPAGPLHAVGESMPLSPGKVSERVQAYERRLSLDQTSPLPANTKQREERTKKRVEVNYGLVPKPSLFVANPDNHPHSGSGDS